MDGIPIRVFKNLEFMGIAFPKSQPMKLYSSIWNADEWATRGGLIKTDWTQAPFTASYRNFNAGITAPAAGDQNPISLLDKLRWVQKNYMIYNYCTDSKRFPTGFPPECKANY